MKFNLYYALEKIMIFFVSLLIYSYSMEIILLKKLNINLTIIVFLILFFLILIHIIINNKSLKINIIDLIILSFISYILLHIMIYSNYLKGFLFIFSSIFPYFFGRLIYINKSNYKYFKNNLNVLSMVVIIYLTFLFVKFNGFKTGEFMFNTVAIGELISIYIIINLINLDSFNINKRSLFHVLLGFLVLFFWVGSRGGVLSTFLAILLVYLFKYGKKYFFRILSFLLIFLGVYFITFEYTNFFINKIPLMKKFSISHMLSDPSIVGNNVYLGRLGLYLKSISIIKQAPILGAGLGVIYSHNIFLEITSALGIIGLLIFITWLFSLFFKILTQSEYNLVLTALFLQSFLYKQTSFSYLAYKTLFIFGGMLVTYFSKENNSNKSFK